MHDSADGGDQIFGLFEPSVWIVHNAASLVGFNSVAVDEPFERRTSIDHVFVGFGRNAGKADMLVDNEYGSFFLVCKTHGARSEPEMMRLQVARRTGD